MLRGKKSACSAGDRRHRFDPCVGKIPWRRAWKFTPVFLPGESHREQRLMGYSPQGCKELDMTETTEHACTNTAKGPSADFSPKGAVESNNRV